MNPSELGKGFFLDFMPKAILEKVDPDNIVVRRPPPEEDNIAVRVYAGHNPQKYWCEKFHSYVYYYLELDFNPIGQLQIHFGLGMHDMDRPELTYEDAFEYYPGFKHPPLPKHHFLYCSTVHKLQALARSLRCLLYYTGKYYHEYQILTRQLGFTLADTPENIEAIATLEAGEAALIERGLKHPDPERWFISDEDMNLRNQSWCFSIGRYKNQEGEVVEAPLGIEPFTDLNTFILVYTP